MTSNPLASAAIRLEMAASRAGIPSADRPLGLRFVQQAPMPALRAHRYSPSAQLSVDETGVPLVVTMGKDWRTKTTTDGDEGPEEDYGWEES